MQSVRHHRSICKTIEYFGIHHPVRVLQSQESCINFFYPMCKDMSGAVECVKLHTLLA